eukprot:CAMPEP_0201687690 /NCGR_PEP_ID=MMETSP0578-20130828/1638_1 /ASSEMBLY_ACC=CAM_ASM_000663 /TAXON_ID=267565 /ORGANISM="Skeletonema grethea, Strain CCMP 1804" /LENGTH=253 /DNA_ID=CAMNT_0048171861 /DNA_START=80 /DNA_END=841 /DNA_ORIENTATION=-
MKLLSLSVALTSIGLASAVLGPGYEDYLNCPPGNCEIYINPFGYTGPVSMYNKCFDTTTSTFSNGVWTGDLTNVTAPEGYVQDPPKCTAEEYSQCDTAAECSLQIGPGCSCFVSSTIFPFDVSGFIDEDSCTGNECDGHTAECIAGADGEGNTCMLKFDLVMPPPVTTVTTVTGATTLPSTPGGGGDGVTVPATLPAGGGGDGSIIKETNTTTNSTGPSVDEVVPTAAPSSGNVARASISLFVVSAAVFGYLS